MPTALVVDDSSDIRLLLATLLRTNGYEVVEADSGQEALRILDEALLPDVVVLDVQMPIMDGWDTLVAIRAQAATAELPVVFCTVKSSPADRTRAWNLACDGYVVKPFEMDELLREVRAVAGLSWIEREARRQERLAVARDEMDTDREEGRWKLAR